MSDTIAAAATGNVVSAIGILRVSGDETLAVIDRVFFPASGKPMSDAEGYSLPAGVSAVAAFRDAGQISGWAYESVERMRQTALLNGDPQGNFNPLNGATRAEAATVFMRLDATIRIL